MTDYKATLAQWAECEEWAASSVIGASDACILELRARVEVLEGAAHKHIVETNSNIVALFTRVESLEAAEREASKVYQISKPLKLTAKQQEEIAALLRPDPKPVVKGPLLVTRVAAAISQDGEPIHWSGAYAAIREVAAWLREQHDGDPVAATALEREL